MNEIIVVAYPESQIKFMLADETNTFIDSDTAFLPTLNEKMLMMMEGREDTLKNILVYGSQPYIEGVARIIRKDFPNIPILERTK